MSISSILNAEFGFLDCIYRICQTLMPVANDAEKPITPEKTD